MHRQSADDDHALIRFDPQAAARIDHYGIRRRRQGQRQGWSASSAAKPSPFQGDASRRSEKQDMYWSAPQEAAACRKASDFSRENRLCQEV
jgi:hypothetical protein